MIYVHKSILAHLWNRVDKRICAHTSPKTSIGATRNLLKFAKIITSLKQVTWPHLACVCVCGWLVSSLTHMQHYSTYLGRGSGKWVGNHGQSVPIRHVFTTFDIHKGVPLGHKSLQNEVIAGWTQLLASKVDTSIWVAKRTQFILHMITKFRTSTFEYTLGALVLQQNLHLQYKQRSVN